jgi:hypothetical protein
MISSRGIALPLVSVVECGAAGTAREVVRMHGTPGVRPLPWPASSLPIGFENANSRSGAVDIGTSGR